MRDISMRSVKNTYRTRALPHSFKRVLDLRSTSIRIRVRTRGAAADLEQVPIGRENSEGYESFSGTSTFSKRTDTPRS